MGSQDQDTTEHSTGSQPAFLTTKEVAELLRVKERKVYDLAAAGDIPHRRVTGKLLFPRADIIAFIDGSSTTPTAHRPAVVTGSHDPLLDWAIRESDAGLASLWNGSLHGLDVFAKGQAAMSGLHVPEGPDWNLRTVSSRDFRDCVLIAWASRARGMLLSDALASSVKSFADLKGRRIVQRQPGAGAAALMDALLAQAKLSEADITHAPSLARTESDAAAMVSDGEADAALGLKAMAKQFHLGFLELTQERFDLLVDRRSYFTPPVQKLIAFARTPSFRTKAQAMGGYDLSDIGAVRWLSP